ncbi:endoribonuclease L-PSP family protein [Mycobacterium kansasii 662]|uniref:Endoribonuclease L-PSP family protein n=1 Tax=Mycobacterium kansasii 662 TaxID=1299326 RepID=X7XSL3_MYCKA|nr:endoribonuclease L-PSP family protein [Mycobacterium kansasii 662]
MPAVRTGNLVYTSGSCPSRPESWRVRQGGADITPEEAKAAPDLRAQRAGGGDSLVGLDSVTRVVKVVGFVASAPAFTSAQHHQRSLGPARRGLRRQRRACAFGRRRVRAAAGRTRRSRADRGGRLGDRDRVADPPAYGRLRPVTDTASVLVADNPA